MPGLPPIDWRVHFRSSPDEVWIAWTTDAGREGFWAVSSREAGGGFELRFINGETLRVEVVEALRPSRLCFRYFGGSRVELTFEPTGDGGCDLRLIEEDVPAAQHLENHAGWVSVLLACKAAVDHGLDLRSHDPERTWDQGFVDV